MRCACAAQYRTCTGCAYTGRAQTGFLSGTRPAGYLARCIAVYSGAVPAAGTHTLTARLRGESPPTDALCHRSPSP